MSFIFGTTLEIQRITERELHAWIPEGKANRRRPSAGHQTTQETIKKGKNDVFRIRQSDHQGRTTLGDNDRPSWPS